MVCMRAYVRLGVEWALGKVCEGRRDSAFQLPQGAPGPRALPQRSSGGPPAGLKRKGVKKSLPLTDVLVWSLVRRDEPGITEIRS